MYIIIAIIANLIIIDMTNGYASMSKCQLHEQSIYRMRDLKLSAKQNIKNNALTQTIKTNVKIVIFCIFMLNFNYFL